MKDSSGGRPATPHHVVMFQRRPLPAQHSVERVFNDVRAALPADVCADARVLPFESLRVINRLRNILFARRNRGGVSHVTGDVHYITLGLPKASTVLTILDLVSVQRLKGIRRFLLVLFWYRLPVSRARYVTVISEATRKELLCLLPKCAHKVLVVPCPVSPIFRPETPPYGDLPVILQVGTGANKNLSRVTQALAGLRVHLRIIGSLNGDQLAELSYAGLAFTQASGLSDEEMALEYTHCDLVVFVSTYEGFGLPILEAQASGRPVITSSEPPMADVAGQAAVFVDPRDVAAIRRAVRTLLDDRVLYQHLVSKGFENIKRFEVGSVAERYAKLYRSVNEAGTVPGTLASSRQPSSRRLMRKS